MEFVSTVVELDSTERFCKDVSRLDLRRNKFNFDGICLNLLSSEMIVDFEMF